MSYLKTRSEDLDKYYTFKSPLSIVLLIECSATIVKKLLYPLKIQLRWGTEGRFHTVIEWQCNIIFMSCSLINIVQIYSLIVCKIFLKIYKSWFKIKMTTKRRNLIVVCLKKFYERGYKRESKDFDSIL